MLYSTKNDDGEKILSLAVKCRTCGEYIYLSVREQDYNEWVGDNPRHVQDVFPYLNASEREMLITQTCGDCWNKMFRSID